MNLPTLYKKTSTGKIQTWNIAVAPGARGHEMSEARILTTYGLLDGKKQQAEEVITKGKNLGKVNETSVYEQAKAEAQSQWEKKSKKGYVQTIEDAEVKRVDINFITGGIDPMLAHSYDKQGHKIKFPAFVQPKLDGHRCIAIYQDGKCTLWSRTRKRINSMPHIERAVEALLGQVDFTEPIILDGELYNHDYKDRFEELTSYIRQENPKPGHEIVQYCVYDIVTPYSFNKRNEMLDQLSYLADEKIIVIVESATADDEEEMMEIFAHHTDIGFEGSIVRNAAGFYKHGRSYDLQKVKTFEDAEFKVVAVEEGKGKMAGKAMFVCELPNGETFRVKMIGALDDLTVYFNEREKWIGKQLTVKFQGKSVYGVPRFPVALRFRENL